MSSPYGRLVRSARLQLSAKLGLRRIPLPRRPSSSSDVLYFYVSSDSMSPLANRLLCSLEYSRRCFDPQRQTCPACLIGNTTLHVLPSRLELLQTRRSLFPPWSFLHSRTNVSHSQSQEIRSAQPNVNTCISPSITTSISQYVYGFPRHGSKRPAFCRSASCLTLQLHSWIFGCPSSFFLLFPPNPNSQL